MLDAHALGQRKKEKRGKLKSHQENLIHPLV